MPRQKRALKPSPFLIRVLNAIKEANDSSGFTSPKWIANFVFPREHPGWTRSCKCGPYGSTTGSGLVMMMGGYLGKLKNAKPALIYSYYKNGHQNHYLTSDGEKMLRENKTMLEE